MAKLINGNGNPAIYAWEDADLIASLAGNVTCIANVGNKYAATEEDANTIGLADGVIITKEGRRIQLDAGNVDLFAIPTGSSGVTNYYIIGYKLVQQADSSQVAETFVQKMNSSSATIAEGTLRGGDNEVYVSVYRVTQVGFTIDSISRLLPELLDNASIKEDIEQINNVLVTKQDEIETIVPLADDYNLDILSTVGVYNCYCTISNIRARYIIKNMAIKGSSHHYYRQIAVPYMGNDSYVFIRYTRYDANNNIVWTSWTPIDAYQYLKNEISGLDSSIDGIESDIISINSNISGINSNISGINSNISGINSNISGLNQKFDNYENQGHISDCNSAPSGVSMAVSTTANSPTPGTGFFVLWTMSTGAVTNPAKFQIASAYGNDYYYFRDLFNGVWSSWKVLNLS